MAKYRGIPEKSFKNDQLPTWEGKVLEQKNSSEISEQMGTIWQHAKFKISNFCKIKITLIIRVAAKKLVSISLAAAKHLCLPLIFIQDLLRAVYL